MSAITNAAPPARGPPLMFTTPTEGTSVVNG
jgi:hypothetical protein